MTEEVAARTPRTAVQDAPQVKQPTHSELQRALRIVQVSMMKQARARGWCSEFEDFVREVNEAAGFNALNARVRRREATMTVKIRVRGPLYDCERAVEDFNNHVAAWETDTVLAWQADVRCEWTGDRDEADIESIMEPDIVRPEPAGVAGCDCESCRYERERRPASPLYVRDV